MKVITIILFVVLVAITGCDSMKNKEFTIKVSGTDGLEFSGSYMSVLADGKSTSKSVDGIIPTEYSVKGNIVSVAFQKKSESGFLKVQILKDDKVINESESSAAYGVVSVATQ